MPDLKQTDYLLSEDSRENVAYSWNEFITSRRLSEQQIEQFKQYFHLLNHYNKQFNLTAIVSARGIVKYHFDDSLALLNSDFDLSSVTGLVDVGAGAGFPALPLKIMKPELPVILIEPNGKKRNFLEMVVKELGLSDVETYSNDWRTFVRTTESDLMNLFVSRAALPVEELCRMFKPSCSYKAATLVYWASHEWTPEEDAAPFITREHAYRVGTRKRRLIFLNSKS